MEELDEFYQQNKDADWDDIKFKQKLIELIFKNKAYFQIHRLDGDILSEFYLGFIKNLHAIMEKYEPERCSFSTYLRLRVDLQIKTSLREYYKKNRKADYTNSILSLEQDSEINDQTLSYSPIEDAKSAIIHKYKNAFLTNHTIPTTKKILILALKSQSSLTSDQMDKIMELTGSDKKEMDDLFFRARQINEKRKKRLEKELERRNELFYKRNQSFTDLLNKSETPEEKQMQINQFLKKDYAWKKKIEFIKKRSNQDLSNKEVADLLGLTQAQVGSILRQVQKFVSEELPYIEKADGDES